jgi:hypothetical protein
MFTKVWLSSTVERFTKTFVQGYLAFFLMASGLGSGGVDNVGVNTGAFDLLFTMNNVKAGAVAAVLSFLSSVASTPVGPDTNSPSLTVTESKPAVMT